MKSEPSVNAAQHAAKWRLYTFTGLNGELPNEAVPIWRRPLDWDFVSKHLWRMPCADGPGSWMGKFRRQDLRKGKGYHVVALLEIMQHPPSPLTKNIQPFLICEVEVRGASKKTERKRLFASARIVRVVGLFDQVSIALGFADIWERVLNIGAKPNASTHRKTTAQAAWDFNVEKIEGEKLRLFICVVNVEERSGWMPRSFWDFINEERDGEKNVPTSTARSD